MKYNHKLLALLLTLCLCLSACGGGSKSSEESKTDNKEIVMESCKNAYAALNSTADAADTITTTIAKAWYFSFNRKNLSSISVESGFSKYTGLDFQAIKQYRNEYAKEVMTDSQYKKLTEDYDTTYSDLFFDNSGFCVSCAIKLLTDNGMIPENKETLALAKELIKKVSEVDPDCKYLTELKQYYADISACFEFIDNPKGTYEELEKSIDDYRDRFKTHKSNLAFDLE